MPDSIYDGKVCIKCKEFKPWSEYHRQRDTFRGKCKRCRKDAHYLWLYGISIDEYEELFEEQDGKCALCGEPEKGNAAQ